MTDRYRLQQVLRQALNAILIDPGVLGPPTCGSLGCLDNQVNSTSGAFMPVKHQPRTATNYTLLATAHIMPCNSIIAALLLICYYCVG